MNTPIIEFKKVILGYSRPILFDIDFTVNSGDFIGIVGPNGVGKTTFLKAVLGLLKPLEGEIIRHNKLIRFGYVPQRQVVDELFPLSVLDIVLMGRYSLVGLCRRPAKEDRQKALQCLAHVGIEKLALRSYRELSGGQKQRTLLARALACEPTILLLDEPTTDMDLPSEREIMELVEQLREKENLTVLIVSHLLHVVVNSANRLAFVGRSKIQIQDKNEAITQENLSNLYGVPVYVGEIAGKKFVL